MGGMPKHHGALLFNGHSMPSGHTLLTFSPHVNKLALSKAPRPPKPFTELVSGSKPRVSSTEHPGAGP